MRQDLPRHLPSSSWPLNIPMCVCVFHSSMRTCLAQAHCTDPTAKVFMTPLCRSSDRLSGEHNGLVCLSQTFETYVTALQQACSWFTAYSTKHKLHDAMCSLFLFAGSVVETRRRNRACKQTGHGILERALWWNMP